MKIYHLYGPMDIRTDEVDIPEPGDGEVLVKTSYVGMCGSDVPRIINGEVPFFPNTIGHEFSGVVEKVGKGSSLNKGDKVVIAPLLVCGKCANCLNGNPGQCIDSKFIGLRTPDIGGLAEYNVLPEENAIKLPEDFNMVYAAMIEPVTVALHAMSLMHFTPEKPVAVIGAGTIGLLAIQCAVAMGASTVYAFDIDDSKLKRAKRLGATHIYNTSAENYLDDFMKATDNLGSPQVIEAVGIQSTILLALEIGSVMCETAIIGEVRSPITIPAFNFYRRFSYRQQNLHGVYQSYTGKFPGIEFGKAIDLIYNGKIKLEPLIHSVDSMDKILDYFENVKRKGMPGKLIFHF